MAESLFESFPASEKKDWQSVAKSELKDQNPFEQLSFDLGGLKLGPYYDSSDQVSQGILLAPSPEPFFGPRSWVNMPEVVVQNENDANKAALEHLNSGAEGILFKINDKVDLTRLLKGIELPYCSTAFMAADGHSGLSGDFAHYIKDHAYDSSAVSGAIFNQSIDVNDANTYPEGGKFKPFGIIVPPDSDPSAEVCYGLIKTQEFISKTNSKSVGLLLNQFGFSFSVGPRFFVEIAKLKAMRLLWDQIAGAYGVLDAVDSLFIHARSTCYTNKQFEPNGNMIKSATAAASAILGGGDAITIESDSDNSPNNRIARNVLTILREESKLHLTADPTGGSFYLDHLIDQMAEQAWKKFQAHIA